MQDQTDSAEPVRDVADAARARAADTWLRRFQEELARHQVGPDDIGGAVARIRAHCAATGRSPWEAFGDSAAYGARLAAGLPPTPSRPVEHPDRRRRRDAARLTPLMMAMAMGGVGLGGRGLPQVPVSVGDLLMVTMVMPGWAVVAFLWLRLRPRGAPAERVPTQERRGTSVVVLGFVGGCVLLWLTLDHTLFTVPKWTLGAATVTLVAISLALHVLLAPHEPGDRQDA